jgi:alpha-L-fucosidase
VDKYQPQLFWFDWWIEQIVFQPYVQRFAAYYYNRGEEWGKGVAINYKNQTFAEGSAVLDVERGQLKDIRPYFWQTDTSISKNSWGYVAEQDYKQSGDIIGDLIDITSKNGALLLNIGPRPDGTIPEPEQAILREIGNWLKINGEAVYDTRPWKVYGEGPTEVPEGTFTDTKRQPFTSQDIRFTQKANALYAIIMARPEGELSIHSLGIGRGLLPEQIRRISLLGGANEVTWKQTEEALRIQVPQNLPGDQAVVFKIELAGENTSRM